MWIRTPASSSAIGSMPLRPKVHGCAAGWHFRLIPGSRCILTRLSFRTLREGSGALCAGTSPAPKRRSSDSTALTVPMLHRISLPPRVSFHSCVPISRSGVVWPGKCRSRGIESNSDPRSLPCRGREPPPAATSPGEEVTQVGTAPANAREALDMVRAGLGYLAAADATQLPAATQAGVPAGAGAGRRGRDRGAGLDPVRVRRRAGVLRRRGVQRGVLADPPHRRSPGAPRSATPRGPSGPRPTRGCWRRWPPGRSRSRWGG